MQQQDIDATGVATVPTDDAPLQTAGDRQPMQGRIGFVGLGRMGSVMAANLAAGGCRVTLILTVATLLVNRELDAWYVKLSAPA